MVSIVSDHANNMMGFADLLNTENDQERRDFNENLLKRKEIKQFGCAAHLLNLIVKRLEKTVHGNM